MGLREQLKDGQASAVPGLHGREGARCVSIWKKGNSQCRGPGWCPGKSKEVRGLEWEAGRVVGRGLWVSL